MYRYYYFQSESLSPSWLGNKQDSPRSQQCPFPSLVRPLLVTSRYIIQAGVNRSGPSWIFWSNLTLRQGCPTAAVVGMGKMGGEGERKRGTKEGRRFFHIMFPLSTQEKVRAFQSCCNCIFFTALTVGQIKKMHLFILLCSLSSPCSQGLLAAGHLQAKGHNYHSRVNFSLMLNVKYHPDPTYSIHPRVLLIFFF